MSLHLFLAYFPYFENIEQAYNIASLSVYLPLSLLRNGSAKIPLSLLDTG
jgi:hypothetical protein